MCVNPTPQLTPPSAAQSGSTLIVVLLVVVLFTSVLVAYFSETSLRRQISFSSSGQARASFVADTAMETIKGDLINEMIAGSTVYKTGTVSTFFPTSTTTTIPQQVGNNGITNIVKISKSGAPMWSGVPQIGPVRSASGNSTLDANIAGRYISTKRWLKSCLVPDTQSTSFPNPDWVILTRGGPIDNASSMPSLSSLADPATSNTNYAIGRYAYVIYNEGALIDITIAGYPTTSLTQEQIGRKGNLAFADLTQIPNGSGTITQAQANALVQWRNNATASGYYNYVTGISASNGYLTVLPGDQTFVSRQDLIRYAQANSLTSALPYFATFTREKNQPSWAPRSNAADLGGNNSGTIYAYKDQANTATSINRNLANVRAADNTLLIPKRFPLSRISLLAADTPDATSIKKYFGLAGSPTNGWTYDHGSSSKILTLDEVKAAGREPDFFELLKAAILRGSLGRYPGNPTGSSSGPASAPSLFQADSASVYQDCQIIQIGANIIDQYDADNIPTAITFAASSKTDARTFYGIENLPYLSRAVIYCYNDSNDPNQSADPAGVAKMGTWLVPEFSRPCQDPGSTSSSPKYIRVQATGRSNVFWMDSAGNKTYGPVVDFDSNPQQGRIDFLASKIGYDHPYALSSAYHGAYSPNPPYSDINIRSAWPDSLAGIYTGYTPLVGAPSGSFSVNMAPASKMTLQLQCSDDGSSWHTYSEIQNITTSPSNVTSRAGSNTHGYNTYARIDPRTDRFGTSIFAITSGYTLNTSPRPTSADSYAFKNCPNATGFTTSKQTLAVFTDNQNTSTSTYTDLDGILRRADGAYAAGSGTDGYPLIPITTSTSFVDTSSLADRQTSRRPVILNRPFRSIGELGYVFRDLPFKDLDFFTKESADSALLDIFSVYDEPEIVAGRISPNTAYAEVLQAILNGASRAEYDSSAVLNTDVSSIASAIVAHTASEPLFNRSDLVNALSENLTTAFSTDADKRNKTRREAVIRALADVSNTRTWNLLIDVIAQSGRYSKNSKKLNDFSTEGEHRYWLHVAIDRYTGEIIDQQYESISE